MAASFDFRLPDDPTHRRRLVAMLAAARDFLDDMTEGKAPKWLVLLGSSGAGKTHLARKVWQEFLRLHKWFLEPTTRATNARSAQFCDWRKFIEECLGGDFSRKDDLRSDWFVVLDDIGAKRDVSGMGADLLDTVLSARSERRWTVITSNLDASALGAIDSRIASRLARGGNYVVTLEVPDFAHWGPR